MQKGIRKIEFEGNEITLMDFKSLSLEGFIKHLHRCEEYIVETGKSDLLLLFDVTDAYVFGDALNEAKRFAVAIQPYRKRSALVGVTGAKKILLNAILRYSRPSLKQVKAFTTYHQAKVWLADIKTPKEKEHLITLFM